MWNTLARGRPHQEDSKCLGIPTIQNDAFSLAFSPTLLHARLHIPDDWKLQIPNIDAARVNTVPVPTTCKHNTIVMLEMPE